MFVNSLFKDFLMNHGLKAPNGESTRDLVCIEFNYGSRSFQDEIRHLNRVASKFTKEWKRAKINHDQYEMDSAWIKRNKILTLANAARKNRNCYIKKSADELREYYYQNGLDITYTIYKKNGEIKSQETIHYLMLYRSTGKAKKGSCMFIRESLYKKAIEYLRMGIEIDDDNPMLVELSAYSPLISSGIVGKVKINPRNILVLKDVDRFFETKVVSVETNSYQHCIAKEIENYKLKNTLFDGQALIDTSIFPSWGNGYILLRQHFCKMAAFHTNIQDFFKDYFGEQYETAIVTDMFGVEHYVKDIELITTDNALKWLKFGKSYDYWCSWVEQDNNMFGVVKTAHPSKLGSQQKMSYQMVNSLDSSIMDSVTQESVEYINKLKTDTNVFLDYLEKNENFSNDFRVLIELVKHNPYFERSTYFRERRKKIIMNYVLNFKSGRIIQNAENLTIVGSPYAMLLYAATGNPDSVDDDDTFYTEDDCIQCYTERFSSNTYLAFFRSPFNSKNNLTYLHNMYHKKLDKYFNFGEQIVAVNMIGTDFQDRNNGADQDSDFGYTTNQPDIVNHAKMCYQNYPTIVNNIAKSTKKYKNSLKSFADIDNSLAKSQLHIGESSNLAQIAQTYDCTFGGDKYKDYVCILSVLAQVAIDSAKRQFAVDMASEIKRIKKDLDVKNVKYPKFWSIIKKDFKKTNINYHLKCPMDKLYDINITKYRSGNTTLPMSDFFIKHELDKSKKISKKIEELIEKFSLKVMDYNINKNSYDYYSEDYLLLRSDFDNLVHAIRETNISGNYMGLISWLLDRAFNITPNVSRNHMLNTNLNRNKSLLLSVLYEVNPKSLLGCFVQTTMEK